MPRVTPPGSRTAGGASLIEVLVALVVVTLGVLGVLALQVHAQRQARLSLMRTVASQLATDLAERMRANRDPAVGLVAYAVRLPASQQSYDRPRLPLAPPAVACDSVAATCSQAEMAAVDLFEWRHAVRDRLPAGLVFIDPVASAAAAGMQRSCGAGVPGSPPCESADVWVGWRVPVPAAGEAPAERANACPAGLAIDKDPSWQCHFTRVRL